MAFPIYSSNYSNVAAITKKFSKKWEGPLKHLYKKSREQYVQLHRCKYAHIRDDPFPLQLNEEETDIRDDEPTSKGNEAEQPGEQQTSGSETAVRYNLRRR